MSVPNLSRALRGWTKKTQVKIITQSVVNHQTVESQSTVILDCNFQPIPAATVDRKPEGQRTWTWWSVIVRKGPGLKTDDKIVTAAGKVYRIQSSNNWSESGFTKYEAVEDYE